MLLLLLLSMYLSVLRNGYELYIDNFITQNLFIAVPLKPKIKYQLKKNVNIFP